MQNLAIGVIAGSTAVAGLLLTALKFINRPRRLRGLHAVDRERWDQW